MEINDYTGSDDSEVIQRIVAVIQAGLLAHNRSQYVDRNAGPIVLAVHDVEQIVVAGLTGDVAYGWLTIETLWVDSSHRGEGLGSSLLSTAEQLAIARGCHGAHLTTYTFQAPGFYERRGYERFAVLSEYPRDQSMVFLRKKL